MLDTTGYSFRRFLSIIIFHVLCTDECQVKKVPTILPSAYCLMVDFLTLRRFLLMYVCMYMII